MKEGFVGIPYPENIRFTGDTVDFNKLGLKLDGVEFGRKEAELFQKRLELPEGNFKVSTMKIGALGDEGFRMELKRDSLEIYGGSEAAVHYAFEVIRAMVVARDGILNTFTLDDKPYFAHRGLLLDSSRHFMPVRYVYALLDVMSILRLNRFHMHLTDDQGWRIEIPSRPEIAKIGGSRRNPIMNFDEMLPSQYYTVEELKGIVQYAKERHIEVIPEIDMPGHMVSLLASHPEIGCGKDHYDVATLWGVSKDVLNPGKEETYEILEDVIRTVSEIFPSGLMHYGGDECPTDAWVGNPECMAVMEKMGYQDERQLQGYFADRISAIMAKYNLKPVSWEETAHGKPSVKPLLQVWLGGEHVSEYSEEGYNMIISTCTDGAYMDYRPMNDEWQGGIYGENNLSRSYNIKLDYPLPGSGKIIGGEGALWTEHVEFPYQASVQLFPRLAALSEAFWFGNRERNFTRFLRNAESFQKILDSCGIRTRVLLDF